MAKAVISCVNLKGGVGKTALAVNLAAIAGDLYNLKTLLVDLDPQTNATFWCMNPDQWEQWAAQHGTVANLFGLRSHTDGHNKKFDFDTVVRKDVFKNVDLVPSHVDLFTMDLDLASKIARERLLKRALQDQITKYDLIVCDCPPNLTLPTQNALAISSHYIVPVSLDYLSSLGVSLLLNRISVFSEELDVNLECAGIVLSRIGRMSQHRQATRESLEGAFKTLVLSETIAERTSVDQSAQNCSPVHIFDKPGEASTEFRNVSTAILKRAKVIP